MFLNGLPGDVGYYRLSTSQMASVKEFALWGASNKDVGDFIKEKRLEYTLRTVRHLTDGGSNSPEVSALASLAGRIPFRLGSPHQSFRIKCAEISHVAECRNFTNSTYKCSIIIQQLFW